MNLEDPIRPSTVPAIERIAPISPGQERLLAAEYQLDDGTYPTDNSPGSLRAVDAAAVEVHGPLRAAALRYAVNELVRRQSALRTTFRFSQQRTPLQMVTVHRPLPLDPEPLPDIAGREHIAKLIELAAAAPRHPERDALFRARLFRHRVDHHTLLLQVHHLISDGWSVGLIFRDLSELYRAATTGQVADLPPLPVTFADLSEWMWHERRSERLRSQLNEVVHRYPNRWPPPPFPSSALRPAIGSAEVIARPFRIPTGLASQLSNMHRNQGVQTGLAAPILTALSLALSATTGRIEIAIGMMVANRARRDAEPLVGYFVNIAILRIAIDPGGTIGNLLAKINSQVVQAIQRQELPIQDLTANLRERMAIPNFEPYQVTLALNNAHDKTLRLQGLDCTTTDIERYGPRQSAAAMPQRWVLDESPDGIRGTMTFRTDSMTAQDANENIENFVYALSLTSDHSRPTREVLSELRLKAAQIPLDT